MIRSHSTTNSIADIRRAVEAVFAQCIGWGIGAARIRIAEIRCAGNAVIAIRINRDVHTASPIRIVASGLGAVRAIVAEQTNGRVFTTLAHYTLVSRTGLSIVADRIVCGERAPAVLLTHFAGAVEAVITQGVVGGEDTALDGVTSIHSTGDTVITEEVLRSVDTSIRIGAGVSCAGDAIIT